MVADHASAEHAMSEMTDAMLLKIKARIREE
jgi:predicted small metal-binding protein